jgi:hypothetical protein
MKWILVVITAMLWLAGCAPYSQLKPRPELQSQEQGYIELKDKDEDFKLKKDKKYFISFPAAPASDFYLVLDVPAKAKFSSFFTASLVDNKTYGDKIKDESPVPERMSVFAVGRDMPAYFWLLERLTEDVMLPMKYRYAPQWRFKFENKYAELFTILQKNRVDRKVYTTLGSTFHFSGFNFAVVLDTVKRHTDLLEKSYQECVALEKIFPASIAHSKDTAYVSFIALKQDLEGEISFQVNYLMALDFFQKENKTQGNPSGFLDLTDDFVKYFTKTAQLPENIVRESRDVMGKRLAEILPFYDQRLAGKEDILPLDSALFKLKVYNTLGTLYEKASLPIPPEYPAMAKFMGDFDQKSRGFAAGRDSLDRVNLAVKNLAPLPEDEFFKNIVVRTLAVLSASILVGVFMDMLDRVFHLGDRRYVFYRVWMLALYIPMFIFLILIYREWKKLGGLHNYKAPEAAPRFAAPATIPE